MMWLRGLASLSLLRQADGAEDLGEQECVIFDAREDPYPQSTEDYMEEVARNRAGLPAAPIDIAEALRGYLGLPASLDRDYDDHAPLWGFIQASGNLCRGIIEVVTDRFMAPWCSLDWREQGVHLAAGMVTRAATQPGTVIENLFDVPRGRAGLDVSALACCSNVVDKALMDQVYYGRCVGLG